MAAKIPRSATKYTSTSDALQSAKSSFIHRLSWQGYHLAILAFSIYLLVVLISYSPKDPNYTQALNVSLIHNAGGTFGAVLADLFFWAIGLVAFLVPAVLIQYEIRRFIRHTSHQTDTNIAFRLLTGCSLVIALCVYASIHISNGGLTYPQGSGGLLGLSLGLPLHRALGMTGTNILVIATLVLAISQFWHLRWGVITETTGRHCLHWYRHVQNSLLGSETKVVAPKAKADPVTPKVASSTRWYRKPFNAMALSWSKLSTVFSSNSPKLPKAQIKVKQKPNKASTIERVEPSLAEARTQSVSTGTEPSHDDVESAFAKAPIEPTIITPKVRSPIKATTPVAKEVKIVPLSETHKQDTGSSEAEQNTKVVKTKGLPPVSLLDPPSARLNPTITPAELANLSQLLEAKLLDFGVVAEVVEVNPGPVITRIEIQPAPGTKVSKISNLSKDLARSMAVMSVRVVEVIAGKSVIGIEIPNQNREMVRISEVIGSKTYLSSSSPLTLTLGNDIAGKPVVVDLAKMPHLLVAGTTGSGKSVGVNAMIMSILLKSGPDQVRMLLVDPKMLELSIYDGIPHLLAPVITDMKEAAGGLRWCVPEMERRYRLMASQGVRNLAGFNTKVTTGDPILDPIWVPDEANGENMDDRPYLQTLPYIVVVVDEFADMIMVVGKKVEELIARIAQKARAAGIHLILATQRPSVDVITGLIKANVPTRIAFQVSSKIDSRTILDQGGAESLLGHGDMLYLPPGKSMPERVHGAFVSDDEVHRVVDAWKQRGAPQFIEAIVEGNYDQEAGFGLASSEGAFEEDQDRLYDEAVAFITETRRASISSVQRKFKIGYNRAARMVEAMEAAGVISSPAHNGSREVLAPPPPRD